MATRTSSPSAAKISGPPSISLGLMATAYAEVLLLSFWLSSMMFFSFAVAPSAFATLDSRHRAGTLVTSVLAKVEFLGLIIGPLLIVLTAITWRSLRNARAGNIVRMVLFGLMTGAAAVSRFALTPTLNSIRNSMGGLIDDVPVDDPLRIQFNDLHHYSVAAMSAAIFAGLVALYFTLNAWMKAMKR